MGFSIHPKTDRVCVPFDAIDEFDPFTVPTCHIICHEYCKGDKGKIGWDRCDSLRPYVKVFQRFLDQALDAERVYNKKLGVKEESANKSSPKRRKMLGLDKVEEKENMQTV